MKETLPENCSLSVIALHDYCPARGPLKYLFGSYDMDKVSLIINLENSAPSLAMLRAASNINDAGFTHLLVQSEFGLTPIMWQQVDLLRWISPEISVVMVYHTPRAYPNEEERAFIRQLSRYSQSVVGMSHYACHSLKDAFGVPASKVVMLPHGVKAIYADMGNTLTSGSVTRENPDKFVLLSDGLIHEHKGYLRVIRALPELVKFIPNIVFRIVGKQHPKSASKSLMDSYINEARILGVKKHLEWIDTFFTPEELLSYYSECDVYVSLYDEITPISGTLTAAMAAGLTIVATPYRYATELLSEDRGIVLPSFDINNNSSKDFVQVILGLFDDFELRKEYGQRAAMGVSSWRWSTVAAAYWNLLLNNGTHNDSTTTSLVIHSDPFLGTSENLASWNKSMIVDFNGNDISFPEWERSSLAESFFRFLLSASKFSISFGSVSRATGFSSDKFCSVDVDIKKVNIFDCLYAIYVDSEVQVNGAIFRNGLLRVVGIRTPDVYILVQEGLPFDIEVNPSASKKSFTIEYYQPSGLILTTNGVIIRVDNSPLGSGISIEFSNVSRFASPKGILGSTLQYKFDKSKKQSTTSQLPVNLEEWQLEDENLFSIQSRGQSWSVFSIEANVYYIPALHDLSGNSFSYHREWISIRESRSTSLTLSRDVFPLVSENNFWPVITLQLEGPFFDFSGFSTVNRALFMELSWRSSKILVRIAPTDPTLDTTAGAKPPLLDSIVKYLMWANIALSRPSSNMLLNPFENFGVLGRDKNTVGSVSRSTTSAPFVQIDSIFQVRKSTPSLATSEPLLAGLLLRIFPLLATSLGKEHNSGIGSNGYLPDVVFRNAWLGGGGPDLSLPVSPSTFWIQSQPWEFWGIPESWLPNLSLVDALVVPSQFSKDSYVANGVDPSKIVILPHGVAFDKIQQVPDFSISSTVYRKHSVVEHIKNLPGCSKFIAVFSGGLLARKGVDVAVKAFLSSFRRADEACLVLHSVYGDGYYHDQIKQHQADYEAVEKDTSLLRANNSRYDIPRLVYLDNALEWSEMIQLFRLGNIFLAPYRAEGFGLIILEAMAAGTAVAVTQAGPALEFTSLDSVFYISQEDIFEDEDVPDPSSPTNNRPVALCKLPPCGPGYSEFSGSKTKVAPRWAAPSVESLGNILQLAYYNPDLVEEKAINAYNLAKAHTWTRPGEEFEMLLKGLVSTTNSGGAGFPVPVRIRETLRNLKNNEDKPSNADGEGGSNFSIPTSTSLDEYYSSPLDGARYSINENISFSDVLMGAMNLPTTLGIRLLRCIF